MEGPQRTRKGLKSGKRNQEVANRPKVPRKGPRGQKRAPKKTAKGSHSHEITPEAKNGSKRP